MVKAVDGFILIVDNYEATIDRFEMRTTAWKGTLTSLYPLEKGLDGPEGTVVGT